MIRTVTNESWISEISESIWNGVMRNKALGKEDVITGLFSRAVVITESFGDCSIFREIALHVSNLSNDVYPLTGTDVYFIDGQSKDSGVQYAKFFRSVNLPVVAILDFDALKQSSLIRKYLAALGTTQESESFMQVSSELGAYIRSMQEIIKPVHESIEKVATEFEKMTLQVKALSPHFLHQSQRSHSNTNSPEMMIKSRNMLQTSSRISKKLYLEDLLSSCVE